MVISHRACLVLSTIALFVIGLAACAPPSTVPPPSALSPKSPASPPSGSATFAATASPTADPTRFPASIYPPPVPVAPGTNISNMTTGCPNPDGLEHADLLPGLEVNAVFGSMASGDLDSMREVTDPAYWPYLGDMGIGTPRSLSEDTIAAPQPASASPYADLIANACGSQTLDVSWWVKACTGPCNDPAVARNVDMMAHYYLIKRRGIWLVWAVR